MRNISRIPVGAVIPPAGAVLQAQGVPAGARIDDRITSLAADAIAAYTSLADPVGVVMEIGPEEFPAVFEGEGLNRDDSPVGPIFRASDALALFAVTVGEDLCAEIRRLFGRNDFAPGAMLDAAASEGTELTAAAIEQRFREELTSAGRLDARRGILRFSPGYCGWHVSAQRKLFNALRPGEIGITLNDSCLMTPIKSISGVAIMGRKEIFTFRDDFSFCGDCDTHPCRERMRNVFKQ